MRLSCRRWTAGLMLACQLALVAQPAHAFLPLAFAAGRIGAFVGAALPYGMRAGGYSARDPRILSTMTALGRGLAQRMGGFGLSIASLPWAKTASYAGIGAVAGVGGAFGVSEGVKWLFSDHPETVTVQTVKSEFGDPPADPSSLPLQGNYTAEMSIIRSGPDSGYARSRFRAGEVIPYVVTRLHCPDASADTCPRFFPFTEQMVTLDFSGPASAGEPHWEWTGNIGPRGEPGGYAALWFLYQPLNPDGTSPAPPPGVGVVSTDVPIDDALDQLVALPDEVQHQPLDDVWLAGLANSVHMAGTLGAAGRRDLLDYWPWSPSHPLVMPSDISRIFAENPALERPMVRDLVEAIAPEGATAVPLPVPNQYLPVDSPGATYPPALPGNPDGSQVDWGVDPNVGAPPIEEIPTASMIVQPFLELWPELRNGDFSVGDGECPIGQFDLFGGEQVMDSHCVLLEANRALIGIAMSLGWSIIALGIVLRS